MAIKALSDHYEYVSRHIKAYSHELVSLIFELLYCRISSLIEAGIAKRQTASEYYQTLTDIGVLTEAPTTKKLFIHPQTDAFYKDIL